MGERVLVVTLIIGACVYAYLVLLTMCGYSTWDHPIRWPWRKRGR